MSEAAQAFASLWLTYLLRSAAAYLTLWMLCRLIKDSALRFRLCGLFLGGMVAAWLGLFLLPRMSAFSGSDSIALSTIASPYWSWRVNSASAPRLSAVLSCAVWAYLAILCLLLLQFFTRFLQLRFLLRSSQPPSDALASLFESVRRHTGAPRCELRLVHGLPSPAATAWWNPKVLVPSELLPRLETQHLVDILRHELMHVRRRDYFWDRLATLGCYLVFFHPAGWLTRRRLRWERELVCDAGSVESSLERRLEYATCLTTLASWRFDEEEMAGRVDFLPSVPSLLAVRVRALVSRQIEPYSVYQRGAVGLCVTAAVAFGVWLVPEVVVTPSWSAARDASTAQGLPPEPQTTVKVAPTRVSKRHTFVTPVAASTWDSRFASHRLESVVPTPVYSAPPAAQSKRGPARMRGRWSFIPRIGTWTIHSIRFGVTKVGSRFRAGKRAKELVQLTSDQAGMSTN